MRTLLILLWVSLTVAHADDIVLTDGTTFKNAKVVTHNATSVTLSFASGVAMVKISDLPPDMRMEYAAPVVPSVLAPTPPPPVPVADDKLKAAVDAGAIKARGIVVKVVPNGLIVQLGTKVVHQVVVPHTESKTANTVPDGLGHTPVMQTITRTWTTTESHTDEEDLGVVFVECDGPVVDSTAWGGKVWPVGTASYTDDQDEKHACPRYTSYPAKAYIYFAAHPTEIPPPPMTEQPTITSPVKETTETAVAPMNP